jgi:RNA polymerase sigma-70 factor, ECF subfamily
VYVRERIAFLPQMNAQDDTWLARFHAGEREVLAQIYEEHFDDVYRAAGRIVGDSDQETVVHEVFCRLLANQGAREGFRGGSLAAWLTTLAKNQAIDFARRYHREAALDETHDPPAPSADDATEAKVLIERFRAESLPAKWAAVFQARFLEQLSQREAAAKLGISRTTLAYQELRVRHLLKKFFVQTKRSP